MPLCIRFIWKGKKEEIKRKGFQILKYDYSKCVYQKEVWISELVGFTWNLLIFIDFYRQKTTNRKVYAYRPWANSIIYWRFLV